MTNPVMSRVPVEQHPPHFHDANEQHWKDYDVRRYAYWSVFAGSCGHTYGHNSMMQMYKKGYPTSYGTTLQMKTWYEGLEDPGYNQMKYLKNLILSFPYLERVPDQSIIVGKNGVKYDRLIATRGKDYLLVYDYNRNSMKLDLTKISGKKKNVWWMNPVDGSLTYLGEFDSKITSFDAQQINAQVTATVTQVMASRQGDGVLIAVDSSKDYITKTQKELSATGMAAKKRDLNE